MLKKIKNYFKKVKRAKKIRKLRKKQPPYLKKDFGVELNYKLWVTKGARFSASERYKKLNQLSSQTVGYLSAYLIIVNLINIYDVPFIKQLSDNELGFWTTALSILILIYSQFESSKNYSIKGEKFHQCSLEIAELYNQLRIVKTSSFMDKENEENRVAEISKQYDAILRQHENHSSIDSKYFKIHKPEYFELSKLDVWSIKIEKYFRVNFKYHIMLYGPVIIFVFDQLR
ncbi:SLATT domain-containing protein [Fulvivirga sp. 29W222]|uniref:SLATT domain-containing protein n=1 Tax=Fulvivirga marina TaxID=2494733 RepID=A0A937KAL8_9BACT|nr:SLATT domain-containing protein [Fulvivirga marina]MBL6445681.1 SLATT domain-containing protein [Fulvivirga marina]